MLAFAAAPTIGVSLLVGLLPVAPDVVRPALAGAEPGRPRILVSRRACAGPSSIAEVAVSLILICGAVLMFKSLLKLQRVDAGVRIDNVDHDVGRSAAGDLPGSRARHPVHRAGRRTPAGDSWRRERRGLDRRAAARRAAGRAASRCRSRRRASARGSSASIRTTSRRSTFRCSPAAASPPHDRAGAPRVAIVNEALAGRLARAFQARRPGRDRRQHRQGSAPHVRKSRAERRARWTPRSSA